VTLFTLFSPCISCQIGRSLFGFYIKKISIFSSNFTKNLSMKIGGSDYCFFSYISIYIFYKFLLEDNSFFRKKESPHPKLNDRSITNSTDKTYWAVRKIQKERSWTFCLRQISVCQCSMWESDWNCAIKSVLCIKMQLYVICQFIIIIRSSIVTWS
jgi:hypothetical protein